MDQHEVTHREIFERLLLVEQKVEAVEKNTAQVVAAFNAAAGAFAFLEFLAKIAKPLMWIGGLIAAAGIAWQNWRSP
jgi:hypothetical protein